MTEITIKGKIRTPNHEFFTSPISRLLISYTLCRILLVTMNIPEIRTTKNSDEILILNTDCAELIKNIRTLVRPISTNVIQGTSQTSAINLPCFSCLNGAKHTLNKKSSMMITSFTFIK